MIPKQTWLSRPTGVASTQKISLVGRTRSLWTDVDFFLRVSPRRLRSQLVFQHFSTYKFKVHLCLVVE